MSAQFVFAQISDTHIRAGAPAAEANLRRALAGAGEYGAAAIVLTGDLVNDAQAEEYALLAEVLRAAPAPVFLLPGNHDAPALMRAAFPGHAYLPAMGRLSYAIDDFPVRLVCVDQHAPGKTSGVFTEADASWLDRTLAAAPDKPSVVALHHPPFLTHDLLFDTIGLEGADLFAGVIARHGQVQRILCGHHHRLAVGQAAHVPVIVAPSSSWAYGLALQPGQKIAPRTGENPGWMLHAWSEQGGFASHFMSL